MTVQELFRPSRYPSIPFQGLPKGLSSALPLAPGPMRRVRGRSALVFADPQGRRCLGTAGEGLRSLPPLTTRTGQGNWRVGLPTTGPTLLRSLVLPETLEPIRR
jgi:hypothetical protein